MIKQFKKYKDCFTLVAEGYFINDVKVGKHITYNKNGSLKTKFKVVNYKNGEISGLMEFFIEQEEKVSTYFFF